MVKKITQPSPIKVEYEQLTITTNGIAVHIVIDYQNMTISLVERDRSKKQYMFCERPLRYESNWNNILVAMREAMDIGFQRLKERITT